MFIIIILMIINYHKALEIEKDSGIASHTFGQIGIAVMRSLVHFALISPSKEFREITGDVHQRDRGRVAPCLCDVKLLAAKGNRETAADNGLADGQADGHAEEHAEWMKLMLIFIR